MKNNTLAWKFVFLSDIYIGGEVEPSLFDRGMQFLTQMEVKRFLIEINYSQLLVTSSNTNTLNLSVTLTMTSNKLNMFHVVINHCVYGWRMQSHCQIFWLLMKLGLVP